jgi:hypothetical protein
MATKIEVDTAAFEQASRDAYISCAVTPAALAILNDSTFTITEELETSRGVCWTGKLKVADVVLDVENRGDGGCNWYSTPDSGSRRIVDVIEAKVKTAIPELQNTEALDGYCSLVEIYHDYRNQITQNLKTAVRQG